MTVETHGRNHDAPVRVTVVGRLAGVQSPRFESFEAEI